VAREFFRPTYSRPHNGGSLSSLAKLSMSLAAIANPWCILQSFALDFFLRCKVVPPTATNLHESNAQKASPRAGQKRFPRVK
jgi:hypothetical protein